MIVAVKNLGNSHLASVVGAALHQRYHGPSEANAAIYPGLPTTPRHLNATLYFFFSSVVTRFPSRNQLSDALRKCLADD